jgi:phosphoserine aminotransferase
MAKRVFNFSAGPAVLPDVVRQQACEAIADFAGLGISILEVSHRNKAFEGVMAEARSLLTELLGIPPGYKILLLQGGSSLQFSMVPMNLLRGTGRTADYVLTGTWGSKALAEAKREGATHVAWDGKPSGYDHLPAESELKFTPDAAYVHVTSNETIQGVEFPAEP